MKKTNKKRYIIIESRGGKLDRYNVFDTVEKRVVKGKLPKTVALEIEGILNGKPHKRKET